MKNLIERAEAKLDEWGAKLEQKNIEYPVDLICGILFLVIGIVLLLIIPGTASSLYKQSWICLIVWALLGVVFWFTQKKEYLAEPAANTKK